MPVIAPFTEEELRSMRAYDRRCSRDGDYRMDYNDDYLKLRNIAKSGEISYRSDAAQRIKAMGLNLSELSKLCGMTRGAVSRQMREGQVAATHVWKVLQATGKPFEYFFQWEKG